MTYHGISFDLEDWQQLVAMRVDGYASEPSADVDVCVERILDMCDELSIKATFFTLGLLAKSRPHVVKSIAERGHEIASHSQTHRLVSTMTRQELVADLRDSKRMLEDLTGTPVVGFRAPEFSIQRLDSPCFAALAEAGFEYDSSVFPIGGVRYGLPDAPHEPFDIVVDGTRIRELPLATTAIGSRRLAIAGGSHFRVLPRTFVTRAARAADRAGQPLVFYFHPYEFSRRFLRLPGGLCRNRRVLKMVALHNFATPRVEGTLRALARELRFCTLRELATA